MMVRYKGRMKQRSRHNAWIVDLSGFNDIFHLFHSYHIIAAASSLYVLVFSGSRTH